MHGSSLQNSNIPMIDKEEAANSIRKAASEGLALFVGAGISVDPPSNCPPWKKLLTLAFTSACEVHVGLRKFYDKRASRLSNLSDLKPELLCQLLYNNLREDFFGFLDILYMGQSNANHRCIARMAHQLQVPFILTTNFDVNIENALEQANCKYELNVCRCSRTLRRALKKGIPFEGTPRLMKIHGSLNDRASIVVTLRQAGLRLRKDLSQLIRTVFISYPVLIAGYSGNDDDVFPELISSSAEAKDVYWVLWKNEEDLTPNIQLFAGACANCKLVAADETSISEMLFGNKADSSTGKAGENEIRQREFLLRWASGTDEHSWKNVFLELLLLIDCSLDVAALVARESDSIIRTVTDPWTITRALVNQAQAYIVLEEYACALDALSRAADNYMMWGHHREVIECLTTIVTNVPFESKWRGNDPLFWSSWLSGKTYEPYSLGLCNYAAGFHFLKERRLNLAESHLLVAAGHAKRSGDKLTLLSCLESLGKVFAIRNERVREKQCYDEINRLKKILGIQPPTSVPAEGQIIKDCEVAAQREMRKIIVGEAIIVLASSIVLGAIACIFTSSLWSRITIFMLVLLTGAAVKIWNVSKRFLKYRHIDRS